MLLWFLWCWEFYVGYIIHKDRVEAIEKTKGIKRPPTLQRKMSTEEGMSPTRQMTIVREEDALRTHPQPPPPPSPPPAVQSLEPGPGMWLFTLLQLACLWVGHVLFCNAT
uniref:Uncharacterized protein n=1 Tax=Opuntia streptacantha TaxID=393608 RepID=A0A7C9ARP8_OPUST